MGSGFFQREGFRRLLAWNFAALRRSVELRPHMTVVSIGCGIGDYEVLVAPFVGRVLGIDLSSTAIAEAQNTARRSGVENVEFRACAVEELSLPDGSVDVVYALGVLHHFPGASSRASLLSRAHAWLAPRGVFYARDPSIRGLPRRVAYPFLRRHLDFHSPQEDHLDPETTRSELEAVGFRNLRLDYTDVLGGPLPWLVSSQSKAFWTAVFAFDRLWLATPGLRRLASQFSVTGQKE